MVRPAGVFSNEAVVFLSTFIDLTHEKQLGL